MAAGLSIVPFADAHAGAVIEVIGAVFDEYGATFDPFGFDADLLDVPRNYPARGGWFAVLLDGARVVGTVAALPHGAGACEIKRVYLLPEYRGRGHGRALMEYIIDWALDAGYRAAIAWSDVRFTTAHAVYARLGFERFGERTVEDADRSREYGFRKALTGSPRARSLLADP